MVRILIIDNLCGYIQRNLTDWFLGASAVPESIYQKESNKNRQSKQHNWAKTKQACKFHIHIQSFWLQMVRRKNSLYRVQSTLLEHGVEENSTGTELLSYMWVPYIWVQVR